MGKLKEVTKPAGQKYVDLFCQLRSPISEAYENYDIKTIIKISKQYNEARCHLIPQIEDPNFKAAETETFDQTKAMLSTKHNTNDQFNEYLIKVYEILECAYNE